eukprot:scaffold144240_cov29-Tisochrysis_lutea.AAC.5
MEKIGIADIDSTHPQRSECLDVSGPRERYHPATASDGATAAIPKDCPTAAERFSQLSSPNRLSLACASVPYLGRRERGSEREGGLAAARGALLRPRAREVAGAARRRSEPRSPLHWR